MTDTRRTEDQLTPQPIAGVPSPGPERRGIEDWMETDRLAHHDPALPDLMTENTTAVGSLGPSLLPPGEVDELRARWNSIQAEFVDEPRRSVKEADKLVANAVQRLADCFAAERAALEKQWDSGDHVSTEDLRITLQHYRAFFGRLLNAA